MLLLLLAGNRAGADEFYTAGTKGGVHRLVDRQSPGWLGSELLCPVVSDIGLAPL